MTPSPPGNKTLAADIIVAGAGPAGVAAALATAKHGLKTLLVDNHAMPGGTVHHAGIHTICGLYAMDEGEAVPAVSPATQQWITQIATTPCRRGRVHLLPMKHGDFTRSAQALLDAQPDITTRFGLTLKAGMTLTCRALIDTTGRAAILSQLGLPVAPTDPTCPGLGFQLKGIGQGTRPGHLDVLRSFATAERGYMPTFSETPDMTGHLNGILNLPPIQRPNDISALTIHARTRLGDMLDILTARFPAFAQATLAWVADEVGFRSGKTMRTASPIDKTMVAEGGGNDARIRGHWPIEWWSDISGPDYVYPPRRGFGIPDACLIASHALPIFTAGMSLSATSEGQSAVRVAGTCLETGNRAGILAAQTARNAATHTFRLGEHN